jgi:hypothetical protein
MGEQLPSSLFADRWATEHLDKHTHIEVCADRQERYDVATIPVGMRLDTLQDYPQCLDNYQGLSQRSIYNDTRQFRST